MAQASSSGQGRPTTQGKAWRALLETHRDIVRYLEREFREGAGIELKHYDVLLHVSEGEGGRRMSELAEAVVVSRSGFTSVVDRLESDGLVMRVPDPDDRRATRVVLTPLGKKRLDEVSAHHRGVVRRIWTEHVEEAEASAIVSALAKVRTALKEV